MSSSGGLAGLIGRLDILRIHQLNERGYLRWADSERSEIRLRYRNRFYGECSLRFRIELGNDDRPVLRADSLTVEQIRPKTPGQELLHQAAIRFLRQVIHRQPELFHPEHSAEQDPGTSWWRRIARRWGLLGQSIEA